MVVPNVRLARAFNEVRDYREAVTAGQDLRPGLLPGQDEIRLGRTTWGRQEDRYIILKTTGVAGEFSRKVNFQELKVSGSVFTTALENNASNDELQAMADDLCAQGCLSENPHAVSALKAFVYFMRSLHVNTARFLPKAGSHYNRYDFDVQVCCIQLALQFKATKFGDSVVLEVIREAYFLGLRVDQFREACKVNGMLDDFLVSWASGLDDEYSRLHDFKLGCLKRALQAPPYLRSLFFDTFSENHDLLFANISVAEAVRATILEAREAERMRLERNAEAAEKDAEANEKESSVSKTDKRKGAEEHGTEEAEKAKPAKKAKKSV